MQSAVSVISAQEPDVVLLDVHLPGGNAQAVLQQSSVNSRFLALSVSDASRGTSSGWFAWAPGGYVTRTSRLPIWQRPSARSLPGKRFSVRGWPVSCSTRSPARPPRPTTSSIAHCQGRDVMRLIARGYTYRGGGRGVVPQRQDRGDPHVGGAAQTAVEQPPGTLARWAKGRGLEWGLTSFTYTCDCMCMSALERRMQVLLRSRIGTAGWRPRHNGAIRVWGQLCEMR